VEKHNNRFLFESILMEMMSLNIAEVVLFVVFVSLPDQYDQVWLHIEMVTECMWRCPFVSAEVQHVQVDVKTVEYSLTVVERLCQLLSLESLRCLTRNISQGLEGMVYQTVFGALGWVVVDCMGCVVDVLGSVSECGSVDWIVDAQGYLTESGSVGWVEDPLGLVIECGRVGCSLVNALGCLTVGGIVGWVVGALGYLTVSGSVD
jgi:hypothetical protein